MKKVLTLFAVLLLILVAVYWFVNRELQSLLTAGLQDETIAANAVVNENNTEEVEGWQFAVIGDTEGMSEKTKKMVEDMKMRDIAFVAHLGDLVDAPPVEEEMQQVVDLFAQLEVPTYYVIGNNDLDYNDTTERKTRDMYHRVVREDDYYVINHENARLFFLDNSYRRDGFPDEELKWLQTELETESDAAYTFMMYHRPLNVPGESLFGDDETADSRVQNEKFRELISTYTITRIFNGHLHTTFNYTLDETPVTVSGGGGAEPQSIFSSTGGTLYHYYLVTVPYDGTTEPMLDLVSF